MRTLTENELCLISGSTNVTEPTSNYDNFWNNFFVGAGLGSGLILSIPITVGMTIYGVGYYCIVLPISYVATQTAQVFNRALGHI